MSDIRIAEIVFFISLLVTFLANYIARKKTNLETGNRGVSRFHLNKWLVGLSAATTGNSGFIVTGAVGLGYASGLHWIMLPISWLLGDLIFWAFFPERLNKLAHEGSITTLSEALTLKLSGLYAKLVSIIVSLLLVIFLSTYTSAQWLAGKKFLAGIFDFSDLFALAFFAFTIIAYSSLGGFIGSVYSDIVQAIIRISGTLIALSVVVWHAYIDKEQFNLNINSAGSDFLKLFPDWEAIPIIGFILGWAFAAIGFGLGQPQIVSRYFAGSSPTETKSAKWIYIGFLQFTWIAMTLFGIFLRGVMPGIEDPETGLSLFFLKNINAIATGIIFADVYATIASTSNGILVSITQILQHDLLPNIPVINSLLRKQRGIITFTVGVITIILSLTIPGNVYSIAVDAITKIASGLAGPMMIVLFNWKHTGLSLFLSIVSGILIAFLWKFIGYELIINSAGIGILSSITINYMINITKDKH